MLYDLTCFRKTLIEEINLDQVIEELLKAITQVENIKQRPNLDTEYLVYLDALVFTYKNLINQINVSLNEKANKVKEVDARITKIVQELFYDNYVIENPTDFNYIRDARNIVTDAETEELVTQRIGLHTNWKYPALEIGCRDGKWTEHMVAADPLYVADQFQEFLDITNNKFLASYQNRLRKYLMRSHDLSALPKNQFGFVFSWGHFNFVSLDTITQVLKQVHELLRPGGVFLFTYNDGDTPEGAAFSERLFQTYIPKSILVPVCESLGFEILKNFHNEVNISWIEVKKPGALHTIKAHQVLGEVKYQ